MKTSAASRIIQRSCTLWTGCTEPWG